MTLAAVLFFLAAALLLYVLFAGADFGAGILELFARGPTSAPESRGRIPGSDGSAMRNEPSTRGSPGSAEGFPAAEWGRQGPNDPAGPDAQRALVSRAMAPVWEANHVWLVLVVVILFMGFPTVYTTMSVHLFVPLVALLVGIVGRGTAFTFRHYDTLTTDWHRVYSGVFAASSLWSSVWLGVLAGAVGLGRIDPDAADAWSLYGAPWANTFCLATAVFTSALFSLLAAVYLVGEAEDPALRGVFRRRASAAAVTMVGAGAAVFATAELAGEPLLSRFFATPGSVASFALATALLVPLWRALHRPGRTGARVLGAGVATLVVLGWFAVQYPVAIRLVHGAITFPEAAAPPATLGALLGALVVGSVLIFPGLGYLFRVFKWETFERERKGF